MYIITSSQTLQAVLCVHYLLNSYKHQLSKQEKHDGKKLLKILGKLGHRVPAQHRRATLVEVNGEGDMPHSPGVIEDFQVFQLPCGISLAKEIYVGLYCVCLPSTLAGNGSELPFTHRLAQCVTIGMVLHLVFKIGKL